MAQTVELLISMLHNSFGPFSQSAWEEFEFWESVCLTVNECVCVKKHMCRVTCMHTE